MSSLVGDMETWRELNEEWQVSLIRTKLCSTSNDIEHCLLSPLDLLALGIDYLECRMVSFDEDHSVLIVVMEMLMNSDPLYKSCLQLWKSILAKHDSGKEEEDFENCQYGKKIYHSLLPPLKELFTLSQDDKNWVRNLVSRTEQIIEKCSRPDKTVK